MNPLTRIAKIVLPESCYLRIRELLRWAPYVGFRRRCPCCGARLRGFVAGGYEGRRVAGCPRCGSLERHRMLWLCLRDRADLLPAGGRLLHFAPERCLSRRLARVPGLHYVTADLDPENAMVAADVTRIPFPDACFDGIICSHVLEHVDDDRAALAELHRVLKPGGWAIVLAPVDESRETTLEDPEARTPQDRERLYGHPEHVRLYGRDYADRLRQVGFEVRVERCGPAAQIAHFGLDASESIHLCTRPLLGKL